MAGEIKNEEQPSWIANKCKKENGKIFKTLRAKKICFQNSE
jgi:hypothetical protein